MNDFNDKSMPDHRIETVKKLYEWGKARVVEDQMRRRDSDEAEAKRKLLEVDARLRFNPPTLPYRSLPKEALDRQAARMVDAANQAELAKWDAAMKREIDEIRAPGRSADPGLESQNREATEQRDQNIKERPSAKHAFERSVRSGPESGRER